MAAKPMPATRCPAETVSQASTTLVPQTAAASCSSTAGVGALTAWGIRARARTSPSSSTATAFDRGGADVDAHRHLDCLIHSHQPYACGVSKPRALVTAPLRGPGLDRLRDVADVEFDPWIEHQPIRLLGADDLAARLAEMSADLLVCEADECKGPVFEQPLRAVASTRGDPTNVDVAGATAAGIPVLHAPGRNADGVAEMAVGLMFAVSRRVILGDRDMRASTVFTDTIPYQRYRAWQMAGRTVGLVGLGAVGRAAKWRFEGLGMKVIAHDPYQPDADCDLDELLANADVVSMHAPVLPDTEGMIGADQFAAMQAGVHLLEHSPSRAARH